jgi:1-acyl-sn-glycerol-3-phosphate acyltransferase
MAQRVAGGQAHRVGGRRWSDAARARRPDRLLRLREEVAPEEIEDGGRAEQPAAAEADPFGLDLDFRERVVPFFRFLFERYWRVEVQGLKRVPATGPAILVANHSGALPFDGTMIVTAVRLAHPNPRPVRFLYDRFVDNLPGVRSFYRRVGGVTASYANTARLLAAGHLVMTFPEGVAGVAKLFTERYRLRPFSSSFIRLSLTHRAPIIPVAVVGAEEAYPLVARLEEAGRLFGVPYIPVTPFFPLLGVAGALPLPTKWFIRFGKPIELYKMPTRDGAMNPALYPPRELARSVRRRVAGMVTRLRRRRQSIFFG